MKIPFTKMHGLGNDFVVLDRLTRSFDIDPVQIRLIADRHYGVGCDQVLLIEAGRQAGTDMRYRIFNADGGEVEQCGNGARCVASYLRERGVMEKTTLVAETAKGVITLHCEDDGRVRVDMGEPMLLPAQVPMRFDRQASQYTLQRDGKEVRFSALSMGNPHAVIDVEDVASAPVHSLGAWLGAHERFPEGVNVGFMQRLDRGHIRLRVYERGVGETLACGSGACAAVVAGRLRSLLDEHVDVELRGGGLSIQWSGEGTRVSMTGPATHVFEGSITL